MSRKLVHLAGALAVASFWVDLERNPAFATASTSPAMNGNGHSSSWDNRFTIFTHGDTNSSSGSKWDLCLFDPAMTKALNPYTGADPFGRKVISVKSSYVNCIPFMATNGTTSTYGYVPSINSDGSANFTSPAYRSNIFEFNALAVVPTPGTNFLSDNPYRSNLNGSANASGSYYAYDFLIYTQLYKLASGSNPNTVGLPQYTFGVMRFQLVIENAFTSSAIVKNIKLIQDWVPLMTGGQYLNGIEPSVTVDGHLMVFQSFGSGRDGVLYYSVNPNPSNTNGWSAPRSLVDLNTDTSTINGQSLKSLYPLARYPLKSNLGDPYSAGSTIRGAYPWVSWEGTDVYFTAANAYNNAVRAAWSVIGDSTGGQLRMIDGAFREYADRSNGTASTLVLFTSGIARTSSIWNPYRETKNAPFPVVQQPPTGLFLHSNGAAAAEVSFKDYQDRRYMVSLNMNRSLQKLGYGSTTGDGQYDLSKTPDTSGNNFYGRLYNETEIPHQTKADSDATEFHGEFAWFKPQSFIRSTYTSSKLNTKGFTVEAVVKPLIDLSNSSDGVNKYLYLTEIPGVMNIILEENRQLHVTLYSATPYRTGFIPNSTLAVNQWSHVAVSWNEQTSRLRVYVNAQKVFDKVLAAGTAVGPAGGVINVGPMARTETGAILIPGHDTVTHVLAIDNFKFSNIVRSQDELADSAMIPEASRGRPSLSFSSAISSQNLRVMGDSFSQPVAQLGSLLFRDNRLSSTGAISCSSCHNPGRGFTDGQSLRIGLQGTPLPFNAPTLVDRAIGRNQTWDGKFTSVSEQMWLPISHANEMGFSVARVLSFLNSQPDYKSRFQSVFGAPPNSANFEDALAAFVNSPISSLSKYDRVVNRESGVSLTADELAGKNLFFGKARCAACHGGVGFTDEQFHNTGIFSTGTFGLVSISGAGTDNRKVKTPSLRHLNLTGPYFHDGSVSTLPDVIDKYVTASSANDPLKSGEMKPISLNSTERAQLVDFLGTLTSDVTYAFALNLSEPLPGTLTVPGAPTGVAAVRGNTQATVSFTAPSNNGGSPVLDYEITAYLNGSGSASVTKTGVTVTTGYAVTGLTNGGSYTFKVRARNSLGYSSYSAASPAVVPATLPGAPTGVLATAGNAQASISFTAPSSSGGSAILDYEITAYLNGSGTAQVTKAGVSVTTGYAVTGLTNGGSYTFRVRARNSVGYGGYSSASAPVTPKPSVPGAPTGVAATPGNGQASVSFTVPSNNGGSAVLDYEITAYLNGSGTAQVTRTGVTVTTGYAVTGLTNGGSYTFKVRARNSIGYSAYSTPSVAVIPAVVPGAPTGVLASAGNAQASVSFTAPSSNGGSPVLDYEITAYLNGSGTAQVTKTGVTVTTGYAVTGLTNGGSYTFKVRARNGVGYSAYSVASAAVVPKSVPGTPTAVLATAGNAQATVSFTTPSSNGGSAILDYEITAYLNGSGTAQVTKTGVTVTTGNAITGLTNGGSYTFKVRARNSLGYSAYSSPSAAVIPATVPGVPTFGALTAGNAQVSVAFKAPSSNGGSAVTGYDLQTYTGTTLVKTVSGTTSPILVTGLTNGTAYNFKIRAKNAVGAGSYSAASGAVTPLAPDLLISAGGLTLNGGEQKVASNLRFIFQTDGNLVLYNTANVALWASHTAGRNCSTGCKAVYQGDGNLVLYQSNVAYWASNSTVPSAKLSVTAASPYLRVLDSANIPVWRGTDAAASSLTFGLREFALYSPSTVVTAQFKLILKSNGNLVITNLSGAVLWSAGVTSTCANVCKAIFQSDGNLVLYDGSLPYWATGTNLNGGTTLTFQAGTPQVSVKNAQGVTVWAH